MHYLYTDTKQLRKTQTTQHRLSYWLSDLQLSISFWLVRKCVCGQSNDSAVKSIYCSCRGAEFSSQLPGQLVHTAIAPAPVESHASFFAMGICTYRGTSPYVGTPKYTQVRLSFLKGNLFRKQENGEVKTAKRHLKPKSLDSMFCLDCWCLFLSGEMLVILFF